MPIYMKIDGIAGDVTASGFEGSMAVDAFAFGANQSFGEGGGGGGAGRAYFQDMAVSKRVAKGTPATFLALCRGTYIPKATIYVARAQGNRPAQTYVKYVLENVRISNYQVTGDGGGSEPTESVSLNFAKITYSVSVLNGIEEMHWDLSTNQGG